MMLSISNRGSAGSAERYYQHLAEKDDYYRKGSETPGRWLGSGAPSLGLSGDVREKNFGNALRGTHPESGDALVARAGKEHRAGWDLTFSAPKSVSVVWATADPDRREKIEAAQREAVQDAIIFMEEQAGYGRRRHGGGEHEPVKLVVSAFDHQASRAGDPQIHTHCFVHNMALRSDGTWGGLESRYFYEWQKAGGAVYRAVLAAKLKALGLEITRDKESFRVAGVPRTLERDLSKRRQEIEKAAEEHGYKTAEGFEKATLRTRQAKQPLTREEICVRARDAVREIGWNPGEVFEQHRIERAERTNKDLIQDMVSTRSVFKETDLWRVVAQDAQGRVTEVDGIRARVEEILLDETMVRLERDGKALYTTREILEIEKETLGIAKARAHERTHPVSDASLEHAFLKTLSLTREQREAVVHLTRDSGGVAALEGWAGVGKSFAMRAVKEAYEADGYKVVGAALSGKAAQELEKGSGIPSRTLHSLLSGISGRQREDGSWTAPTRVLDTKTVIVLDEAGMVDSQQMHRLMTACQEKGAKLILGGDWRQLQAIGSGVLFKDISQEIGHAEISTIRRQNDGWARDAVKALAEGRTVEGLAAYRERGYVHAGATPFDAKKQLVRDYLECSQPFEEKAVFAATREEVRDLNTLIRDGLKERKWLGDGHILQTDRGEREFSKGDRILFLRNDYEKMNIKNGTLGTLERMNGDWLSVCVDGGRIVDFSAKEYPHFDHGYSLTLHKGQGATVAQSFGWIDERMDREMAYVLASRAKEETHLYCDKSLDEELEDRLAVSHQKETSLRFEPPNPQKEKEKQERGREKSARHERPRMREHGREFER